MSSSPPPSASPRAAPASCTRSGDVGSPRAADGLGDGVPPRRMPPLRHFPRRAPRPLQAPRSTRVPGMRLPRLGSRARADGVRAARAAVAATRRAAAPVGRVAVADTRSDSSVCLPTLASMAKAEERQELRGGEAETAVANFPVSGEPSPVPVARWLGRIKGAAARVNAELGLLDAEKAERIAAAAARIADGELDDQFPIDVFQTGSGTSSNMNANEVIASRAIELLGGDRFHKDKPVHPNDHVNMGQSTNDIFPTAIHVAVAIQIERELIPALKRLHEVLAKKAKEWDKIIKIGRTHLADATPLRLGQEIGGFARQIELSIERAKKAIEPIFELPAGGTAVGTGINTHPEFGRRVAAALAKETGLSFIEARDHFEANAQRDGLVECHGQLRTIAVTLFNVANNIRWLGSGPRCAFYEVKLPDRQPGSSIMPGKVNP